MGIFMFSIQFRESKTRKTSMPLMAEMRMNSLTRLSG